MRNRQGFTLLEMMVVLSVIGILLLIVPVISMQHQHSLTQQCELLHAFLLKTQAAALYQHTPIAIRFLPNGVKAHQDMFRYQSMYCEGSDFHYTAQGTISQAQTIHCYEGNQEKRLVLQLGSGAIDVR